MENDQIEEPMYYGNEYTELQWRGEADTRERAEEQHQREHTQDYAMEAGIRSDLFNKAAAGTGVNSFPAVMDYRGLAIALARGLKEVA